MRSRASLEVWKSPKVAALCLGALCLIVLLVLATLTSAGANVGTVASNARSLHWINSVLGSSALFRAANAQAVVFAVDHELGVASDTALEAAAAQAGQSEGGGKPGRRHISPREGLTVAFRSAVETVQNQLPLAIALGVVITFFAMRGVEQRRWRAPHVAKPRSV